MKLLLAVALACAPAHAADLSQWPSWKAENRRVLQELIDGFIATDASVEEKSAALETQRKLLALIDGVSADIEASVVVARRTILAGVRDQTIPPAQGARDMMRLPRLREAHLAYFEGTLIRQLIDELADELGRARPKLAHMVPGPEYVATVRANAVDTKALGAKMDLSKAEDILAAEGAR